MKELEKEIRRYWGKRASGYSEYNRQELKDERRELWRDALLSRIDAHFPDRERGQIRVLDAGTGPGFFALLLAEAGYQVTAVDCTREMLDKARENCGSYTAGISWHRGDVQNLPFDSETFHVVVSRNVTWNLPDPQEAYREWRRVLKKDGLLLNFDADWYGYLYDEEKRSGYEKDRARTLENQVTDYYQGTDIQAMEAIALQIPLSRQHRPAWDLDAMKRAGYAKIFCDGEIWKQVWNQEELLNNQNSPLFLVQGVK